MAFNFSVFKVRTLSAIVFAVVMMFGLLFNQWSFFTLFLVIQLGCLFEYQKLVAFIFPSYKNITSIHKYGVLAISVFIMIALGMKGVTIFNFHPAFIALRILPVLVAAIFVSELLNKKWQLQNWAISIVGLVYITLSLSLFYPLRAYLANTFFGDWGYAIPLVVILTIWVNDTMAYLVGSFIGRTPLSSISPNKTWEGTIAGVLIAVLLITKVLGKYIPIDEQTIFLISSVSAIAGTFGDLLESKLKRMAGVKDSGQMMPGHGGFLDRFDSIILATPFVWLLLQILF
jgi:phosphatidate cytidylyltransferase